MEIDSEPIIGTAALALTPKCVVVIRAGGVQIQQPLEAPPLRLDLAGLHLLAAISTAPVTDLGALVAQVARRTGTAPAALTELAFALRYGELLMPGEAIAHAAVPDRALPPDPQTDALDEVPVALRLPQVLRLHGGQFELLDHDGRCIAALSAPELHAVGAFVEPLAPAALWARIASGPPAGRIDRGVFRRMLARLRATGMLRVLPRRSADTAGARSVDRQTVWRAAFERHAAAQDAAERSRGGRPRVPVVPVAFDAAIPTALGMIVAYAKAHEQGRLQAVYDFRTDWLWSEARVEQFTAAPAIYLFSNYLWSHRQCIEVSKRVKARSPASITIHGGPDTPKYDGDSEAYFAAHPHVDVTVRGEGEVSAAETLAALAAVVGPPRPDLSLLAGIAGISYRAGGRVHRNPDRPRIANVDALPSPFLTGLFDVYRGLPEVAAILETNRGCPYGCTFCDWGSATNTRVRQFALERVLAELTWCAEAGIVTVSIADANFGAFKRDVDLALHVAALRRARGAPQSFGFNYAKNSVKNLQPIVRALAEVGIITQGVLSLQTMDPDTLTTIHRANIKTEKYDALAVEMRRAHLPLMIELMMGLPGQSLASFAADLQQCIDRDVSARVNHTTLLVNSPMNEPAYRAAHRIETAAPIGPGQQAVVIATRSFSREDYTRMEELRVAFLLFENWGVLRLVSRFVRHETGIGEIDFYDRLRATSTAAPQRWPTLYALTTLGTLLMAPPYSWALVCDELRQFLVGGLGIADDDALAAVLRTQHAVLPAHGRTFPAITALPHDVVAWHRAIVEAKNAGHRTDWPTVVPRLRTFGPGTLTVDDPHHVSETSIGIGRELALLGTSWDLESPLSRARVEMAQLIDLVSDVVMPRRGAEAPPAT